jgi:transcriptional regulator with XRE-family HTH domain
MVGKRIRFYRKANKYTQEQLGDILKIDQSYLGRIERGEVNITLETIQKISEALHIAPSHLLEHSNESTNKEKNEALEKVNTFLVTLSSAELKIVYRLLREALALKNV